MSGTPTFVIESVQGVAVLHAGTCCMLVNMHKSNPCV